MSDATLETNCGDVSVGQEAKNREVDHEHEHEADDMAPLREVRPRSSRGLLRKDTPAVLDTTSVKKGLLSADLHHSPLVTEEDETDENIDATSSQHATDQTTMASPAASSTQQIESRANNDQHQRVVRHEEKCSSDAVTINTVDKQISSIASTNSHIGETDNATQKTNDEKSSPRGITVEYCDGTRPKSVQSSNGGVRGCVRTEAKNDELKDATTVAGKGKKPVVTFKEKHGEGFHAHTKSGTKVLMRKETPASLPSVQKVKAAQRFRHTSESLTEENHNGSEDEDADEKDLTVEALTGACGEG